MLLRTNAYKNCWRIKQYQRREIRLVIIPTRYKIIRSILIIFELAGCTDDFNS